MVVIEAYRDCYAPDFKAINSQWIEEYIGLNDEDMLILSEPKKMIIDKGGSILIANHLNQAVGTICLERNAGKFMITKLGVLKAHRGKGVGAQLCRSILDEARKLGASEVWLETSQKLEPAIGLYKKLGFEDMNANGRSSRCDVLMRLVL